MAGKEKLIIENILESDISEVLHKSMMPYSEYVILDRALPRVEDGLKPVQRRILFTMFELGVSPDKPHKKSARIVGDCLGKYHPHGDSSVYGATVRMAQNFNMSAKLVDGHGNFGSVDGDPAAAMRYTEVRLQPLAMEMLRDIDKDTVDWGLNFDDTMKEPRTLPGRYPNLLVNGASGIAVGLATNIPPHNITEVIDGVCAYIDNPDISLDGMMEYIKAPDFPTGGQLIVGEDLKKAYETGKGKVAVRCKADIEKDGDKYTIVVTELPYQVNKAVLVENIDRLRETKKEIFGNISEIIDASDRQGMRIIIKIRNGANPVRILDALYKHTSLQQNFNINIVAIAEGKPQQLGLLDLVRHYVVYQKSVIYRRCQYELALAKAREHILQGLIIAIDNIDEVIKIIRSSASIAESKTKLRERFSISEKQAHAIVELKLGRLTKLDVNNLRLEIAELIAIIEHLTAIVKSPKKQYSLVRKELLEIRKQYKTERRSKIFIDGVEQKIRILDINEVDERSGVALLVNSGCVKFLSAKAYNMANKSVENCGATEIVKKAFACDNKSPIYVFTNKGNVSTFAVDSLTDDKWRSKGTKISKLIPELASDEYVVSMYKESELNDNSILTMTKNGMLKVTTGADLKVGKRIYQGITLKGDDEVLSCEILDANKSILMVSGDGIALNMESDIPVQGRKASGVIGMSLRDGDSVVFAGQIDDEGEIIIITDKCYAKRVIAGLVKVSPRNRKGNKIQDFNAKNGSKVVFAGHVKNPYDLAIVGENSVVISVNSDDLNIENMNSRGKPMKNIVGEISGVKAHNLIDITAVKS